MNISKTIRFEAGHRLAKGYPGNCQHIHGHSYVATVEMKSTTQHLNNYGFVKDFNDFKNLKEWIDSNWDHAFLVNREDLPMLDFLKVNDQRHFIFESNPTAELIAKELFKVASELLNDDGSQVCRVLINETSTSEAEYTLQDDNSSSSLSATVTETATLVCCATSTINDGTVSYY